MKKKDIVLVVLLCVLYASIFIVIGLFDIFSYQSSKAESPLDPNDAYITYTANNVVITSNPSTGYFNNGYSFVFYGTPSSDGHLLVSIVLPNFNAYDFYMNTFVLDFNATNKYNNIALAGFTFYAYDTSSSYPRQFYRFYDLFPNNDFGYMVGNPYLNSVPMYDNIPFSIEFVFDFVYYEGQSYEFSFNDFYVYVFNDYSSAYDSGYIKGYSDAETDYYLPRYDLGYSDGFNAGASGQYSFFALISAVVETPINAVLGMLDFNFLDINLKSFFLSVFTIALIIMILRFVLAKN